MKTRKLFLFLILLAVGVVAKSQSDEGFKFKNSHSITYSDYAFILMDGDCNVQPILASDFGWICTAQPFNSNFYAEIGANLTCAYGVVGSMPAWGIENTNFINMFSFNIPLNFGYKIDFTDKLSLSPYIGVYQRVYFAGNLYSVDGKENVKLFARDGLALNRNQIGVSTGLKLIYNKFSFGIWSGYDFSGFDEETRAIHCGLNFAYTF